MAPRWLRQARQGPSAAFSPDGQSRGPEKPSQFGVTQPPPMALGPVSRPLSHLGVQLWFCDAFSSRPRASVWPPVRPGVAPACSGLPRRCAAPSPPPPAPRPQKSALQPLSPRPWEVRVRSGGDRFARGSTESRRSHSEASGLSAGKVPDGGHKPPPARGSIFFSCPLNLGRDRGCLDHTGKGTPRQSPIPPCRSPPFPRSSSSIHPSASAAEHTGDGDSQACAAERFAQTSA